MEAARITSYNVCYTKLLRLPDRFNLMNRGRPSLDVDLKSDAGRELVLRLSYNFV